MIYCSDDPNWVLDMAGLHEQPDWHNMSWLWRTQRTRDAYLRCTYSWAVEGRDLNDLYMIRYDGKEL
jgi:hypothetical protein